MEEHRSISLADQVFERLENDILSGKYPIGTVLTEMRLVSDLGVSRTPIREALHRLGLEHLVETGAKGILISMSVSPDVGLEDVDYASTLIAKEANPDANIIWGVSFDQSLEDEMRITIIATGFQKKPEDANRAGATVKTNPGSPFRRDTVSPAPAQRPAGAPARPMPPQSAQRPAVRPAAPAQRPVPRPAPAPAPAEDDDFDDLIDMVNSNRRKN